ncbi:MAG: helix-turn-helix domain-containing protein [Ruminococcus sp.]|jgi:transcriptional regulator with XRE-family HTH domain|nr:helix-turn-helix domain-containing protein [Ruminococcus sp.]
MNISLANKLSALRRESSLSEDELAVFLNITGERVYSWERAESEPTATELFELSKLYHISVDEILKSEIAEVSQPISLKKERPDYIREKRPESYTEKEVFPQGYKASENRQGYPNITFAEPEYNDIKIETVNSTAGRDYQGTYHKPEYNTESKTETSKQSPFELGGIITPETAEKIEIGLNKAGEAVGTVVDKIADEVRRAASENKAQSVSKSDSSYSSPPGAKPVYKNAHEQAKWEKYQYKQSRREEKRERKKRAFLLDKLFPIIIGILFYITVIDAGAEGLIAPLLLSIPVYYIISDHIKLRLELKRYKKQNPPE